MRKLFQAWRTKREASKKLEKLLNWAAETPEIMDAMLELAEATAKNAVMQKLFDETQQKDIDAMFFRKLVDSAQAGVVIDLTMNNAHVILRKEDVYDDMARHRFQQLLQERSGAMSPIVPPKELGL